MNDKIHPETRKILLEIIKRDNKHRGDIGYSSCLLKLLKTPNIFKKSKER